MKRCINPTALLLSLTLLLAPFPAITGMPVLDYANLMQAAQQYVQLTSQLEQLRLQYQQEVQHFQSITGARDVGSLFNSSAEQQMRTSMPSSWQEALRVLENGGLPGNAADVLQAAQRFSRDLGIHEAGATLYPANDGQNPDAVAYATNARTTAATAGIGQAAFDQSQARMQRVQQYLERINDSSDLKASIDLNARLLAELNESMAQLIQLQSTQMQLLSAGNADILHGRARDAAFTPYPTE